MEEEKKAIKILNNIKSFKRIGLLQATETFYEAIETALNLIEKQNKKIEELKVYDNIEYQKYLYGNIEENYIPKSVIREKIEELEKLEKGFNFTGLITECEKKIEVLNELLGGSNETGK